MSRTILFVLALSLSGCSGCAEYRNIPSGFAGKVLTPTGFEKAVHTSGQVNIGKVGAGGIGNTVVLVENTSVTVKESFLGPNANPDKEDHRIVLGDMVPLSVDIRISFMSPDFSKSESDKLFTLITPEEWEKDPRMSVIRLSKVYATLGKMGIRAEIRKVFDQHGKDYKTAMAKRGELNDLISAAVLKEISESGFPLKAKAADLSMIMPDESVWKTNAAMSSADAQITSIKKLAKEINEIPNGMDIYRMIITREIVEIGSKNGTNTVIMPTGNVTPMIQLPAKK